MKRSLFTLVTSALVVGSFGIACGDGEPDESNPVSGSGGNGGTSTGGGGGADGVVECAASQAQCGDLCASVQSDPQNCGLCDNECGSGEGCLAGVCADFPCRTGQVVCDDQCVNLQSDRANCGDCGTTCGGGEVCSNGQCETSCADGLLACDGACIDPMTDAAACGAGECGVPGAGGAGQSTGTACEPYQACVGGACEDDCPTGQIACDGACVDPSQDSEFCGATDCSNPSDSGTACSSHEACDAGSCVDNCPAGQIICGGRCVSPESDPAFCGATNCFVSGEEGSVCNETEACVDGSCADACPGSQIVCGGECITPATDDDHCGATDCSIPTIEGLGASCREYQSCVDGTCETDCAAGEIVCGGACVDPRSSNDYCGATDCISGNDLLDGDACTTEQSCVLGDCREFVFAWSAATEISDESAVTATAGHTQGTDAAGNTLVVWRQESAGGVLQVWSRRYLIASKDWTTPVRVDTNVEKVGAPKLAVSPAGDALAVWDTPDSLNGIWASKFDDGSDSWGTPFRVDDETAAGRADPGIAMDDEGNAWVIWSEETVAGSGIFRVHRSLYDSALETFSSPTAVSGYGEGANDTVVEPIVASNAAGATAVVWLDRNSAGTPATERVVAMMLPTSGGAWSTPTVLNLSGLLGGYPVLLKLGAVDHPPLDVDVDSAGNAFLVWSEFPTAPGLDFNILASKFSAGNWSAPVTIADTGEALRAPRIATHSSGRSMVTFYGGADSTDPVLDYSIHGLRLDASLAVTSDTVLDTVTIDVDPATPPDPAVAVDSAGNFHVVWAKDDFKVQTARFDDTLSAWGAPEFLQVGVANAVSDIIVTTAPGGRAYSSWYWGTDMWFARFD